jgi:hypothetical protein
MEPGAICNQPGIIAIFSNQNKRNAIRIFTKNSISHGYALTVLILSRRENDVHTIRSLGHE